MASKTISEFYIKVGATLPAIPTQLVNPDGTPMDLTGVEVYFKMKLHGSKGAAFRALATITNVTLPAGSELDNVEYVWQAGDTDVKPGTYDVEWEIVYPNGKTLISPNHGYNTAIFEASL